MAIACITGASSGIGMEFAKQLSFMGYNLILVARNRKALKELADSLPTKCMIITCDLASEDSCRTLADKLKKYNIRILINNAGFGDVGAFCETSLSKELDMIDVNVKATHILTKELLPGFIKRDCGYILNVASSAGLLPGGPYMATYYATKAYVTSFTSAIYEELKDMKSNVHISALCPGPVDTNFNELLECGTRIFPSQEANKKLARQSSSKLKIFVETVKKSAITSPFLFSLSFVTALSFVMTIFNKTNWQFWLSIALTALFSTLTLFHQNKEDE